jgi:glyoxylase-like metal-dependent hydrolase (beta-lactamase superfamily II)
MIVKQFRTGGDRNFGYLAADETTGEALVVDPSYSPALIVAHAAEQGYTIRYVFSTHGHEDHCNGNGEMERLTGVRALRFGDSCRETGIRVADGVLFQVGSLAVRILHTPGHTPDSMCILAEDALFTGDTLFVGKVGGTWDDEEAREEYHSLHDRLMVLPDLTKIYPGHDYGTAPVSTVLQEKTSNPFLLQPDFKSFLDLKENWAAYKKAHGIL